MSLLSRLFGGGEKAKPELESEIYKDFAITPDPIRDGSKWRISARIEKEVGGEMKSHTLIRADTLDDVSDAKEASVNKAKLMIDQQGDGLFD